ncbi:MAG: hypothetical protein KTR30_25205 [Saprospiraceae bacterium]|nr:hypothetical protein [Saprospiraceae bacterium]
MKKSRLFFLFTLVSITLFGQNQGRNNTDSQKIPMKASSWEFEAGQADFIQHKGVPALKIKGDGPPVFLKDMEFANGTIEFDLELVDGPFVGINFRRQDPGNSERFYLRPHRVGNPMGEDAIQYAPVVKGANLWDMLHEYQGPAVIRKPGWNHIKMVVSGKRMRVYVNSEDRISLDIPELLGDVDKGKISFDGNIILANLEISPNQVEGLSPQAGTDPTASDIRYLREWEVSQPIEFPFGRDIKNEDLPNENTKWEVIQAERFGLVNLTRKFGGPANNERKLVWLRTKITAKQSMRLPIDLGFSDEVWVIINGGLLYLDKNYYRSPIMKQPAGRCSIENTQFELPLQEGENELLIGVGNFFFGWGVIARLQTVDGLSFPIPQ